MAVVRNIQNNQLYRYIGNDIYRNIITGKEGKVDEEIARKIFRINLDATVICEEYPLVEKLIQSLNLKIDKT